MKDVSGSNNKMTEKQKQMEYLRKSKFGDVTEEAIVRDLLFVFQGIQGQHIAYSFLEDAFVLAPNTNLSPSTKKLVNELSELGWLYKKVNDWLNRNLEAAHHCN